MTERIGTRTCDRCGARAVAWMPNKQWLCKPCWIGGK